MRRVTKSESPKSKNQTKKCFVICPIGKEGSEQREWSDTVINEIIRPVAETLFQYHVFRADEIPTPGTITRQIVEHLISSELVIADLSFNNPNVFYELAVRHVTRKPYIQMINQKESIPFDTGAIRTIQFNTDIKYANKAKRELEKQISAIESGEFKIDNPVGDAIDLMSMKNSVNPENYDIAILAKSISEMQSQLYSLTQNIENRLNSEGGKNLIRINYSDRKEQILTEMVVLESDLVNLKRELKSTKHRNNEYNTELIRSRILHKEMQLAARKNEYKELN